MINIYKNVDLIRKFSFTWSLLSTPSKQRFETNNINITYYTGHVGIVRLLIRSGMDVNTNNALLTALFYGKIIEKIVTIWCKKNVEQNLVCFLGYSNTAEVLIESGANVDTVGRYGESPLTTAAAKGRS